MENIEFEDIEKEEGNEDVVIDIPFNPNKIKVIINHILLESCTRFTR